MLEHNQGHSDLHSVGNLSYFSRVVGRISTILMIVVIILGVVALVVGGVGILNIMLVSASERTPEIGIQKALGARQRQILDAFLLEVLGLSLAGGLMGILIGCGIPGLLTALFDLRVLISFLSIGFALAVSAGVGVFFGYYPARCAARLDPIQALRYE